MSSIVVTSEPSPRGPGVSAFAFDPSAADAVRDPDPTYKHLRDSDPARSLADHKLWLITRDADVANALVAPAVWSSTPTITVDPIGEFGRVVLNRAGARLVGLDEQSAGLGAGSALAYPLLRLLAT